MADELVTRKFKCPATKINDILQPDIYGVQLINGSIKYSEDETEAYIESWNIPEEIDWLKSHNSTFEEIL